MCSSMSAIWRRDEHSTGATYWTGAGKRCAAAATHLGCHYVYAREVATLKQDCSFVICSAGDAMVEGAEFRAGVVHRQLRRPALS